MNYLYIYITLSRDTTTCRHILCVFVFQDPSVSRQKEGPTTSPQPVTFTSGPSVSQQGEAKVHTHTHTQLYLIKVMWPSTPSLSWSNNLHVANRNPVETSLNQEKKNEKVPV